MDLVEIEKRIFPHHLGRIMRPNFDLAAGKGIDIAKAIRGILGDRGNFLNHIQLGLTVEGYLHYLSSTLVSANLKIHPHYFYYFSEGGAKFATQSIMRLICKNRSTVLYQLI